MPPLLLTAHLITTSISLSVTGGDPVSLLGVADDGSLRRALLHPTSYLLQTPPDSIFQSFSLDNFPVRGEEQDCGDLYQHSLLFLWSIK